MNQVTKSYFMKGNPSLIFAYVRGPQVFTQRIGNRDMDSKGIYNSLNKLRKTSLTCIL